MTGFGSCCTERLIRWCHNHLTLEPPSTVFSFDIRSPISRHFGDAISKEVEP